MEAQPTGRRRHGRVAASAAVGTAGILFLAAAPAWGHAGSKLNLVLVPGKAGPNSIHLSYSDQLGRPIAIAGPVVVELTLPAENIGPITAQVLPAGTGHYIADQLPLTPAGKWEIVVLTKLSEFDEERTVFDVTVH